MNVRPLQWPGHHLQPPRSLVGPEKLARTEDDRVAAFGELDEDLGFFFEMCANDYLLYLEANARAVAAGEENVRYSAQGVEWEIPSAPYRAECFNALKQRFAGLDHEAERDVRALLNDAGIVLLEGPTTPVKSAMDGRGRLGRLGRPVAVFD